MFSKKEWKNRVSEYPTRRILTDEAGAESLVTVARSEGTISQEGDAFSAENMNDLEQRIYNATATNIISGTLQSGETSITLFDASITADSIVDPYQQVGEEATELIAPLTISVTAGSCTMTFDEQDADVVVGIRVV